MSHDGWHISDKYLATRQCVQCGLLFTEINNIGRHQCRIHPGLRLRDHKQREYFSCCGLDINAYREGYTTSLYMAGCVAIDHMDTSHHLSNNNLDDRLCTIKSFSVIAIPTIMLSECNNIVPPSRNTILFDYTGISLPISPTTDHLIDVLHETRINHDELMGHYDPYRQGPTLVAPLIDTKSQDPANTKYDTIRIDIHGISRSFIRSMGETKKRGIVTSGRDGWPDPSIKKVDSLGGDNNTDGQLSNRKREAVPFMIIQRIGDKLNIHGVYSKLNEG